MAGRPFEEPINQHDQVNSLTMQINPYLSFKGQCEAAFTFYEQCLGGQLGPIFRYAGSPMAEEAPADWQDKIMHGSVTIGGQTLMVPTWCRIATKKRRAFSLSLHMQNTADAERIFHELAEGGRIVMPLEKTFWAARFGMVVDRFGIPWLINCEGSEQPQEG